MKTAVYAAFLLLASCAAPTPTEFRDGAPMRTAPIAPRTTFAPNGAGLPEYWGRPEPQYPKGDSKRTLPQTPQTMREPGLWSADSPMATGRPPKREHGSSIPLLGIEYPDNVDLPSEVKDGFDAMPAEQCWYVTSKAAVWATERGIYHRFEALTQPEKLCLFYRVYYSCLDALIKGQLDALEAKYAKTGRGPNNDERRLMKMSEVTRNKANNSMKDTCEGRNHSAAVKALVDMVSDSTQTLVKGTIWIQ